MGESPQEHKPKSRPPLRLGEALIAQGIISSEQLDEALAQQRVGGERRLLGDVLIELGFASHADIIAALAASVSVPFCMITERMVDIRAGELLPDNFADTRNVLVLNATEDWITVAAENPTDIRLAEEIERFSGRRVQFVASTGDNIKAVREAVKSKEAKTATSDEGAPLSLADIAEEFDQDSLTVLDDDDDDVSGESLEAAAADSPVIKLVNYVIHSAVGARASDIHIEPDEGACRIRFRVNGDLAEQMKPPVKMLPAVVSRIKIMAGMDISERRKPQDGAITVVVGDRSVDLRVSTMPAKHGEKVVIRVIDNNGSLMNLDALGFSPSILRGMRSAVKQRNGIVLVTGPTGSGKSTTLYATLAEVMSDKRNISTVEDPVEYNMKGVNQFQINTRAGFTFPSALRALLRQDPDIVMVGEIRDVETAKLATEAALTGHLVFSTLHTNDAPSAVTRLINMGVEPFLVAASLRAVLAQRLVRKLCPSCRTKEPTSPAMLKLLSMACGEEVDLEYTYDAPGCPKCDNSGCVGRVAVHEFLEVDEAMLASVGNEIRLSELQAIAAERGYRPLLFDGIEKVRAGEVSLNSLFEVLGHPPEEYEAENADEGAEAEAESETDSQDQPAREDAA